MDIAHFYERNKNSHYFLGSITKPNAINTRKALAPRYVRIIHALIIFCNQFWKKLLSLLCWEMSLWLRCFWNFKSIDVVLHWCCCLAALHNAGVSICFIDIAWLSMLCFVLTSLDILLADLNYNLWMQTRGSIGKVFGFYVSREQGHDYNINSL